MCGAAPRSFDESVWGRFGPVLFVELWMMCRRDVTGIRACFLCLPLPLCILCIVVARRYVWQDPGMESARALVTSRGDATMARRAIVASPLSRHGRCHLGWSSSCRCPRLRWEGPYQHLAGQDWWEKVGSWRHLFEMCQEITDDDIVSGGSQPRSAAASYPVDVSCFRSQGSGGILRIPLLSDLGAQTSAGAPPSVYPPTFALKEYHQEGGKVRQAESGCLVRQSSSTWESVWVVGGGRIPDSSPHADQPRSTLR